MRAAAERKRAQPQVELSHQALGDHVIQLTTNVGQFRGQENCRHPPPPALTATGDPGSKTRPSQPPAGQVNAKSQSKHLVLHCLTVEQNRDLSERLPKWI